MIRKGLFDGRRVRILSNEIPQKGLRNGSPCISEAV